MQREFRYQNEMTIRMAARRILVCGALCMLLGTGLSIAGASEGYTYRKTVAGPGVIWFSLDDYAHFDQTPIIWRNNFEFGDTMGWD